MSRRLVAALVLVAVGRLLSPAAIPVYDGIGAPDEPYRYVAPPDGARKTAEATEADATSPVVAGVSSYGMSAATAEQAPQFSLFLPPKALAATGAKIAVRALPSAPADQPAGSRIDGNVYTVSVTPAGATLTPQAALASLSMRATTSRQPPPAMQYRASAAASWAPLETTRGGTDVYFVRYVGPGQYALAFAPMSSSGGSSPLPYVLIGLLLLVVVVVVVRFRAAA